MQLSTTQYLSLFSVTMIIVGALTPIMKLVAIRFGVVDNPNQDHKTHKTPVPYLGGVAIMIGAISVTYLALLRYGVNETNLWLASSLVIPACLLGLIGLLDDVRNLSPWPRFLAQSIAGLLNAIVLIVTDTLGSPTGSLFLDVTITIVWIVGITNSINFFDNVDGGASGTVAIASLALFLIALQGGQFLIAALAVVLSGAAIGFLSWNRPPARIYMGDAGALFLGFLIASLTIRLDTNPINQLATFSIPFLILAVPIMDTSVAVISRIRRGISPFQGGRDHLSHRLMRSRFSKRQSVFSLWLMSAFFGSLAFAISYSPFKFEGFITVVGLLAWTIFFIWFLMKSDS
jgi:UDP-GlcNAc:undecaprenyl-phosphate GlcNAc-1-phosphate transferase